MREQGVSQKRLADIMGVTPAVISLMLNGKQQSSKLVEPISALLSVELPPLDAHDPQLQQLANAAEGLDAGQIAALIAMAKHYKSAK